MSHGLPVLFHCGPAFHPRLYSRFTHPLEYDQVAADFPNLTMIMGHAGNEWWADCVAVAQGHPNMVLELSEWQMPLRDDPEETVRAIGRMRDTVGIERIVWASDFPGKRTFISLKDSVGVFRDLPSVGAKHSYRFTDADVEAMLGGNAARLLGLQ